MQEEGFIAKILYPEGAKDVKLGNLIAILVDKQSDIAAFANYTGAESTEAPQKMAEVP
jgi:pyruvate dehydrogenase E2 component (dihydrolipoamide acetyltransferase)